MRLGYNFPMKLHSLFAAAMLAATIPVQAQLSIEITGAGANRIPIAVADFAGERVVAQALVSIVRADLERSGMFRLVDAGPVPIDEPLAPIPFARKLAANVPPLTTVPPL